MSDTGYTVKHSIATIDEYCDNPELYKSKEFQGAINDAKVHYQNGNASKEWYDQVVRILSAYL